MRVNGDSVALAPYNPFVTAFSNYSLGRASGLSVRTDVTFGKGKYDAKTSLTLQRLSVKGAAGDTLAAPCLRLAETHHWSTSPALSGWYRTSCTSTRLKP